MCLADREGKPSKSMHRLYNCLVRQHCTPGQNSCNCRLIAVLELLSMAPLKLSAGLPIKDRALYQHPLTSLLFLPCRHYAGQSHSEMIPPKNRHCIICIA